MAKQNERQTDAPEVDTKTGGLSDAERGAHTEDEYDADFTYLGGGSHEDDKGDKEDKGTKAEEAEKVKKGEEDAGAKTPEPTEDIDRIVESVVGKKKEEPVVVKPEEVKGYEEKITTITSERDAARTELEALKSQLEQYANTKIALEALQRDPHAFVRQYLPELASHLDPNRVIYAQLKKEFGEDFKPDAAEAYEDGTPSNKYRLREEELRDERRRQLAQNELRAEQERLRQEGLAKEARAKVQKRYGLNDEQYQKEIVDYFKGFNFTAEHLAMIRFREKDIEAAIRKALEKSKGLRGASDRPEVGAAELRGEEDLGEASEAYKEHQETFGD